jgi:26S proteasome regulatory subunit N4
LRELIKQKDEMEKEIATLTTQIETTDEAKNFNSGLTDAEGFPRADIDFGELANYRNLKRRKAELNNDHVALMKVIEQKLFALHASYPQSATNHISETHESKGTELNFKKIKKEEQKEEEKPKSKIDYLTPFAKISLVFEGSPAATAGLQVEDLLSELAEINIYALDWQKQIAEVVREGQPLKLVVMRPIEAEGKSEYSVFLLKDGRHYEKR